MGTHKNMIEVNKIFMPDTYLKENLSFLNLTEFK